jgi:hypothetical protein
MPATILFEEVQQFKQKALEGLMLVVNTVLIVMYAAEVFKTGETSPEANLGLLGSMLVAAGLTLLLKQIKLITQITTDGIQVRFAPLQRNFQLYRWDDIDQLFIRTYNPVLEYGGWGLRFGPSGSAYNASGDVGLQLVLHGNYKILIGTTKPELLIDVLQNLGRI